MIRRCLVAAAVAATALPSAAAAATPALRLGFSDVEIIQRDPLQRPLDLQHLKSTRASTVRMMWRWSDIERSQPPDAQSARNPAWTGYDWNALDGALRDIEAVGLVPLVEVGFAPSWWEGSPRPVVSQMAPAGTWRPDAAAYGRFMQAAAARYSGTSPDPLRPGRNLPRVRFWQAWNEPNLPNFLTPQWSKTGSRFTPASPGLYRTLLNAAYDGIKSSSPGAVVITAGTAPFGEPWPGGTRMPPARFVREMLCVSGRRSPRAANCRRKPAKFDILAHHPYPIGPPGRHAINPDDVCVPDFAKLSRPLAAAVRAGNVFPRKSKQIWATEMSWDSSPPDPGGVEPTRHARYAAGAMYVLWRQGVKALIWWNLRDEPRGNGYQFSLQSGVFFRGNTVAEDRPKPALTAFKFPFTAYGSRRGAKVWGLAPRPGKVRIQRQQGTTWRTIRIVRAGAGRSFEIRVRAARGTRLRAMQDGEASIDAKIF